VLDDDKKSSIESQASLIESQPMFEARKRSEYWSTKRLAKTK
jgi:hypothetical protein